MELGKIQIQIGCPSCGLNPTVMELPDDHTDDSIAKCKGCGADLGRFGDIKEAAIKLARENLVDSVRKRLKGSKGFSIK